MELNARFAEVGVQTPANPIVRREPGIGKNMLRTMKDAGVMVVDAGFEITDTMVEFFSLFDSMADRFPEMRRLLDRRRFGGDSLERFWNNQESPWHEAFALWSSALWAKHACPVFDLDTDLARALAETDIPPLDMVRAPFPAFLIRGVGIAGAVELPGCNVSQVFVSTFTANDQRYCTIHAFSNDNTGSIAVAPWSVAAATATESMNATQRACARTIAIAINMSAFIIAKNIRAPRPRKGWKNRKKGYRVTAVKLSRPTKLSGGATATGDMIRGARCAPSVTHVVRGHFKRQRHGPGRSQEKTIWIEPYRRCADASTAPQRMYSVSE